MADHALMLLQSIQSVLDAQVPLAGGWMATRLDTPTYPFGTIDMTSSTPVRGQAFYAEQHRGVGPPPLKWSAVMFRKRRIENGKQTTEAGRDCLEVAAG